MYPKVSQPSLLLSLISPLKGTSGCVIVELERYMGNGEVGIGEGELGMVLGRWFGLETVGKGWFVIGLFQPNKGGCFCVEQCLRWSVQGEDRPSRSSHLCQLHTKWAVSILIEGPFGLSQSS
ncbi:hypothetical protein Tco_0660776 [Tanacetum coccineum]